MNSIKLAAMADLLLAVLNFVLYFERVSLLII
jgi:hypothetical protein